MTRWLDCLTSSLYHSDHLISSADEAGKNKFAIIQIQNEKRLNGANFPFKSRPNRTQCNCQVTKGWHLCIVHIADCFAVSPRFSHCNKTPLPGAFVWPVVSILIWMLSTFSQHADSQWQWEGREQQKTKASEVRPETNIVVVNLALKIVFSCFGFSCLFGSIGKFLHCFTDASLNTKSLFRVSLSMPISISLYLLFFPGFKFFGFSHSYQFYCLPLRAPRRAASCCRVRG